MNKFPMRALSCALSGLVLCLASAQAATQFSFTIKGTVVSGPACILNANTAIDVKFGSALQTTSIDGSNYATPVPFTLTCVGNPSSLRLRFQGPTTDFGTGVLSTNFLDLGIQLLKPDNSVLAMGEWFTFAYSAMPPAITAVPVKRPGATLPGGVFNSTATLLVEVI